MTRTELVTLLAGHVAAHQDAIPSPGGAAPTGVMLVRLQRLREFRLQHGYAAGDTLASTAHQLIQRVVRPQDVVCRIGDLEFVVLLPELHDRHHAALAGNRVVRAFQEPLLIGTRPVLASVAIGISVAPEHGRDPEILLRNAELALGTAMRSSDHSVVYTATDESQQVPYEALRDAIAANQLEVHLQPILDLRSNTIVGAESLARWHHAAHGTVAPDIFIPLAEETGLISELTRWSVNATMRHAAIAREIEAGLCFSINLSPRVFGERDIVAQTLSALRIWGVPPADVTLEVTETALMEDPAASRRLLDSLRHEGFAISIDDFGSGYSSLAYLKQFPATELKIDRAFVMDMQHDTRSMQLVRSIIDLGHHLGMSVVAEGVEDAASLDILTTMGCDRAQGYHIRRPQPAADFIAALTPDPEAIGALH